jgi:hypothetical protein
MAPEDTENPMKPIAKSPRSTAAFASMLAVGLILAAAARAESHGNHGDDKGKGKNTLADAASSGGSSGSSGSSSGSTTGSSVGGAGTTGTSNGNSADSARSVASGVIVAFGPSGSGSNALRITNAGNGSGAVAATLYDGTTGAELGVWTGPSIAPFASVSFDLGTVAGAATPKLTTAQAQGTLTLAVRAEFQGSLQTFAVVNGIAGNTTQCDGLQTLDQVIGGVPGPGAVDLAGAVRLVNGGTQARAANLTLYKASDGTKLGTWTSPSVPAHASLTVGTAAIAAAATPVVDAGTAALTLAVARTGGGLQVQALAQPKAGGVPTILSTGCRLRGGTGSASQRESGDDGSDASDTESKSDDGDRGSDV